MTELFSGMPGAAEIEGWARLQKAAEHEMADLMQRLLLHTASPSRCDIPVGKATNESGADAEVTSPGSAYCPAGDSLWDWGVSDPDDKANADYRERTRLTDEATQRASTFVFVSPWRWAKSRAWAKKKLAEGKWKDVWALDSSDLAGWLTIDFATHLWLSELILGPLVGRVRSLQGFWEEWAQEFYPPRDAIPELVLAGRTSQAETVRGWVGTPGHYTIRGASTREAAAFVAAALMTSEPHRPALGQAAVIESEDLWNQLVASGRQPMILVPMFESLPYLRRAIESGHTIIQGFSLDASGRFEIELPAARESDLVPALRQMDVDADSAGRIAKECGGSMAALRRTLSSRAGSARWVSPDIVRFVGPAAAAGRWDEALDGDRAVMAELAGVDYETFVAGLVPLTDREDPPVRLIGSVWTAISQLDGLRSAARELALGRWEAFENVILDVLGTPDPAWELPEQERWLANVKGKARPHSAGLRAGLTEALTALATQPEFEGLPGQQGGQGLAERAVRRLLQAANDESTGRRWADLEDQLPLLAEAAPNIVILEIQRGLEGDNPVLGHLLVEERGMLIPRSRATGLLWALERLAWSPDYLSAVIVILARLASLDPGGRLANRPASSMAEILMPWHPQTTADREGRLAAAKAARRVAPVAVWSLLVRLLPKHHDIGGMTSRPEWRSWAPAEDSNTYPRDYWKSIDDILGLLLADAADDASRWKDLVDNYDDLPDPLGERVLLGLESLDLSKFSSSSLELLSDTMNEIVSNHRAFAEADWALPESRVARLEAVAARFVPADPVFENLWLFERHPSTQRVSQRDYYSYEERLRELRNEAVQDIHAACDWAGIESLVDRAKDPYVAGAPIFELGAAANDAVLTWAASDEKSRVEALKGYLWARNKRDGWTWSESFIRGLTGQVSTERQALLLLAASREEEAWALAAELGPDVERAYWSIFDAYPDGDALWKAARNLITFDRPFGAIQIIGTALTLRRGTLNPELAFEALDAARRTSVKPLPQDALNVSHEVGEIIKALDGEGFDPTKLAGIEWSFLPVLEPQPEALKHIHRRLADEPVFFVDIVEAVFRGEAEEPPAEPDPSLQQVAKQAYELLRSWHGPIPGQTPEGTVDAAALNYWVDEVRARLAASGRSKIGDQQIGHALWYAPIGADEFHPHEAVRELFERIASQDLDVGYEVEGFNSRGVVTRGLGGDQERELAARYAEIATVFREKWPRMAGVYRSLDDSYKAIAKQWDERAALD